MIRLFAAMALLSSVLASSAAEFVNYNGADVHPTRVLVKYKKNPDRAALVAEAAAPKVDVQRRYSHIPGLAAVQLKDQAAVKAAAKAALGGGVAETIRQLKATGLFEYVEPDYVKRATLQPTDRRFIDGTLWGLSNRGQNGGVLNADINVIPAWDVTTGDTNIIVAVIDTGINYTHRDLAAQMWVNPGEIPGNNIDDDNDGYVDNVYGINAIADSGDPKDDNGHGSHCAGTIGAAANNGFEHVGVIWKVRLMALKFLGDQGFGFDADEIQCINFSIQKNVKITSNSYGASGPFSQAEFDAIAAARAAGQLFIAAAGNDGEDNDRIPHYPSSYDLDNIIAVAALDRFDKLASFSNFGAQSVDIGAPGVDIFSCWFDSDTAYNTIDGTSMATPHVAGAAALLLAADPTSDYLRLRTRLLQRGTPIPALTGLTTTGSRLNVYRSMSGQVDNILEVTVSPPSGSYFLTNAVTNIIVRVTDDFNVNDATVNGTLNGAAISFINTGTGVDTNANDGIYTAQVTTPGIPGFYNLGLSITAPGKQSTNLTVRYEVLPKPANDDFSSAIKFPPQGGIKFADNRLGTIENGEPLHAGRSSVRSLWWNWSTPSATQVIVDTAGTSFDDDAVLGIYTGSSVSGLLEVNSAIATANGPNGTRAPFVKFDAQPNITYWIAVAQSDIGTNSPGRIILRVQPNGDVDTQPPVVRVTNYVSGVFIRSTDNTIVLSGVAEDPPPNASGIREADGVQYKVNDDILFKTAFGSTNWSTAPIQLTNGYNHIFIKSFDRADNESATVQFTVNYIPQEIFNDLFGFSTTLTDVSGSVTGTNAAATKEFGEASHGNNEGGHSLWWAYTPPADGVLLITTEGSDFDTLLGLYTVNDPVNDRSVSDLIPVAQDDDANAGADKWSLINTAVDGGRQYYIAVDGFGGQTGKVVLNFTFSPVSTFELTTSAGEGGTVTPASGSFPSDSAVTIVAQSERYRQLQSFTITANGQTTQTSANPYTFAITGDTTIHAEFGPKIFTDDFESGNLNKLPYQISSSATEGQHWFVQTVVTNSSTGAASQVARVTPLLHDNSVASLVLVTNLLAGKGSFEFSVNTETNFDKLEFFMDGARLGVWSGNVPWGLFTFDIPLKSTPTRLEWRYTKDPALGVNNELVAIDNLDLPIAPPLPPPPTFVTVTGSTTGITIHAEGAPNNDFRLESSTDLINWSPVPDSETNSGSSGVMNFTQPITGTTRYFRVVRL